MMSRFAILFALVAACLHRQVLAHVARGTFFDVQQIQSELQTANVARRAVAKRSTYKAPSANFLARQIRENIEASNPILRKRQNPGGFGQTSSSGDQSNYHGTTEGSAAQLENIVEECIPYNLPIITEIKDQFPVPWNLADIMEGDTQATQIMQAINSSNLIPSTIGIRGTPPSSYNGAGLDGSYNLSEDPDCWWTDKQCTTPKSSGLLPDVTTCPEPYTWGYTFDDGPNCTHNALYDMWAQNNQKVSLMYIGSNVLDWPLQAQRGIVDGHHICVHTWSHRYMTALTDNQVFAELFYTMKVIKYVMGVTPTCWRPPYGDVDDRVRAIAQGLGLRTILWNVDTNDWNLEPYGPIPTASMQQTYSSIIAMATQPAAATGGVIVLEHELEDGAMNMSTAQYPAMKAAWKHIVPLSACLNITNPYPEDIVYPDFAEYISGDVTASGLPNSQMSISTSASVQPQGTLSGMGGTFPTADSGAGNKVSSITTVQNAAQQTGSAGSSDSSSSSRQASHSGAGATTLPVSLMMIIVPVLFSYMFVQFTH